MNCEWFFMVIPAPQNNHRLSDGLIRQHRPNTSYPTCSTGCSQRLGALPIYTYSDALIWNLLCLRSRQSTVDCQDLMCCWSVCEGVLSVWMWVCLEIETKLDELRRTPHWALSGGIKCRCHFCITAHTPALFQRPPCKHNELLRRWPWHSWQSWKWIITSLLRSAYFIVRLADAEKITFCWCTPAALVWLVCGLVADRWKLNAFTCSNWSPQFVFRLSVLAPLI